MEPTQELDDIGWALLHELQDNARLSFSELGRRVGLTPPAVADRVRRMEEAGIIRGYRLDVDTARVGLPLTAVIRVTHRGVNCLELGRIVSEYPEVLECHRITGAESYSMKVALRSVEHLQELIDRLMPYGETVTSIVLSSPVTHRSIERDLAQVAESTEPATAIAG
ncbi:MAG TPA: Lrp/AsnC family transcriptional regulator [Actinomycetota bacterium]|nr:Lrp/AsnC family transcriptional regulator [Actinomycetota bacterium]